MKKVNFEVAQVLKKVGYPQGQTDKSYIIKTWNEYNQIGKIVCLDDLPAYGWQRNYFFADIPTYLDVWRWLWREKGIYIDIAHYYSSLEVCVWDKEYKLIERIERQNANADPEEAIIVAIEYLCENDLIK